MKKETFMAHLALAFAALIIILLTGNNCSAQVVVSISSSAGTLSPTGTATLTATVTGTTGTLKYFYSGTNTSGVYQLDSTNPCTITGPGIYSLMVTDANYTALGEAIDTIYSSVLPTGSVILIDSAYSCAGNLGGGRAMLNYTGFFVPLSITFSPLGPYAIGLTGSYIEPVQDTFAGFSQGQYIVSIMDALGQSLTDTIQIPLSTVPDFSSYITASPDTIGSGQNTIITVHFQGGVPPYSATVLQPDDVALIWNTADSVYSFTTPLAGIWQDSAAIDIGVGSSPRCNIVGGQVQVYTDCIAGQCVWPGDANWDGVVNNFDLLPIGLAYDSTGPVRPDTTINWYGHYAPNWSDSLQDSINYKYIDCNGNGVINADDTLAITQNYTLTYTRSGGFDPGRAGDPVLYPHVLEDTTYNGDTLLVQLVLGTPAIPTTNVYGLAFTLNYDKSVVDTSKTTVTFGNSWLGSSVDKISLAKDLKLSGQLQCALTRINHTTKSGNGVIGVASFVITTDNLNGKNYSFYIDRLYISDVKLIDSTGNILPTGAGMDSALVGYLPTLIRPIDINNQISIYPNPASSQLVVTSSDLALEQIKITDIIGNVVLVQEYLPDALINHQQLDISTLSSGIYLVEVKTQQGSSVQKLVLAK